MTNPLPVAVLAALTGTAGVALPGEPAGDCAAHGIIESVSEVLLVVRLDDGRAVTLRQSELQQLAQGERVVLLAAARGARVERAPH